MSSRFTVDTTYLKIRDVFAFNANSGEVIQRDSVPVIGHEGHVDWKSSLEFISTISVPTLSTTVLGMLTKIQPGFSTLSTVYFSTTAAFLTSTVQGLGSLPNNNDYVSSSKLLFTVGRLTGDYGYISSTQLYDCINRLGNLNTVGPILNIPGSNFPARGYVSTLNPGEYRIYQSSLLLQGANLENIPFTNANILTVTEIDVRGYAPHIVGPSKMRIDINTNMNLTHPTSVLRNFSTFFTKYQNNLPIGSPVVMNYTATSLSMPYMTFILKYEDLNGITGPLQLKCSTDSSGTINTFLPTVGGIHITLDNTD
jgi:hypothetical protein